MRVYKWLLMPGISLMGALSYKVKFLLISFFVLIPVLMLSGMIVQGLSEQAEVTLQEQAGLKYMTVLSRLLSEVTSRRGALHAFIRGDVSYAEKTKSYEQEIDRIFLALLAESQKSILEIEVGKRTELLQKHWNNIKNTHYGSVKASFDGHQSLIDEINKMTQDISISSNLILDPEVGSYLLATIMQNRLPVLITSITQLRRLSGDVAVSKVLSPEDVVRFAIKKEEVEALLKTLEFELATAYSANNEIRSRIQATATSAISATHLYLQQLDTDMGAVPISMDPTQCYKNGLSVVEKIESLDNTIKPTLGDVFDVRLAHQQQKEWFAYGILCFLSLGIIYLFIAFYTSVHQAVMTIQDGTRALANGQYATRIDVEVKDEMANIATSFNAMAKILEERSAQDEHERVTEGRKTAELRERLSHLRDHIEIVSSGNLSKRLEITGDDDLASLGMNLNAMTESLAEVTSGTSAGINAIFTAVAELQQAINGQSVGASEQAAAVNETTAALDQIKGMAAQAMERVKVLGETADRSRRESELGGVAVEQAIAGMGGILHRMEGIAQTILALSEQIQQIGEITGVVTNLAQQSKMLALNASIEAAKAGEAGKGFAVVAAEVRELAEQSQQSTAQVQKILQDIRHATDRAVMATEQGSKGVDAGMLSVQRSGEVMRQLGEVVRETVVASHQISAVVKQQFIGLEHVTSAMSDINKVTAQFVINTHQSKAASVEISKVVGQLNESVSIYQL